ncbi:MAG: Ig-like domain repeat protein [Deltaproteobacteria bacterium]|nr:Ig-like domain repeat protein [Deltaproteobacteria bacterium]
MKSKGMVLLLAGLLVLGIVSGVWAANPDKVTFTNVQTNPSSTQSGQSGNYTLTQTVKPGDTIDLSFGLEATGSGQTSTKYSRTVNLTVTTTIGPTPVTVAGLSTSVTFSERGSKNDESATITVPEIAPAVNVPFQVKVLAEDSNKDGNLQSDFIFINFTVVAPQCEPEGTTLELGTPECVIYHATKVSLTATLTKTIDGTPLSGKNIDFYVDNNYVGSAKTNNSGVATLDYNPSQLTVGDHALSAAWTSDDNCLQGSQASGGKLGVQYLFLGFQPPINADGSTILTGKCGPVKVKIVDANGVPVPDATALVYFEEGTPAIVGTDPENATAGLNFDYGNVMRYSDGQYVYNWNLSTVTNGTYTIRVWLDEGECAPAHQVVVSVGKKK